MRIMRPSGWLNRWGRQMEKQPEIRDAFSDHVFTVEEVEPGLFQSVFPERLAQESELHTTADDAWSYIEEIRQRDIADNGQFGVGA